MDTDDLISQFISITGADKDTASQFIRLTNGDLSAAVSCFLASDDSRPFPNPSQSVPKTPGPSNSSANPRTGSRIATLKSTAPTDSDTNTFYAGGEKSGVAIQGGSNQPPSSVSDILKLAAENRARPDAFSDQDDSWDEEDDHAPNPFSGTGFRLGTEEASIPAAPVAPAKPKKAVRTLNFWANGFSIDQGPLFPFSDPQTSVILDALKSGRAPLHVLNVQHGQPVDLKVAHHPDEQFKPPPPPPFSGQGNRLGTSVSLSFQSCLKGLTISHYLCRIVPGDPTSSLAASNQAPRSPPSSNLELTINESQPITSLQIRLADGTRMVARFNTTHTVGQLRAYVAAARTNNDGRRFTLSTGFPARTIVEDSLSLDQAKLLNSVVVQKWD